MARPRKKIDKEMFKKLCAIFCTLEEIAGVFNVSTDTIERWCQREYKINFADVYKIESAKGKMSLRRHQFELSKRSAAMAIWLGKNYLDQTDNIVIENHEAIDRLDSILRGIEENAISSQQEAE